MKECSKNNGNLEKPSQITVEGIFTGTSQFFAERFNTRRGFFTTLFNRIFNIEEKDYNVNKSIYLFNILRNGSSIDSGQHPLLILAKRSLAEALNLYPFEQDEFISVTGSRFQKSDGKTTVEGILATSIQTQHSKFGIQNKLSTSYGGRVESWS